jgi:TPP-dependent pyruvate/acetoin dehydrogenase alpha subunit
LREAGFDEASIKAIEAEITAVVDEAFVFAENSPWPDPSTALDDIFV